MLEPVYISSKKLNSLKVIGEGTDGRLYKLNNKTLLKIYHHYYENILSKNNQILDENGVNIAHIKLDNNKNIDNSLRYYDEYGVKLTRELALLKAIERQKNVKYTNLPSNLVYVDNRLKGCVINYHRYCTDIYKTHNLPYRIRFNICREILEYTKELLDNYIYHIDLAQKPTIFSNNTNILLSYKMKPIIIDIDGKSAVYTEHFSEKYYNKSLYSLSVLLIELLSRLDLNIDNLDECDFSDLDKHFPIYMLEDFKENKLTLSKISKYLN